MLIYLMFVHAGCHVNMCVKLVNETQLLSHIGLVDVCLRKKHRFGKSFSPCQSRDEIFAGGTGISKLNATASQATDYLTCDGYKQT